MDVHAIESYREGDRLEAKAAGLNLPRSLWETYSSFANTSGGLIVLGIEERGRQLNIVGVSSPDKLLEDFWNAVNNPKKVSSNILSEKDVEAAIAGGVSDPRNATVSKIFSFAEIGERAGSGLPKIFVGWKACGLPEPTITESFDPDRTVMVLPLIDPMQNRPKKPAAKTGGKNRPNNAGERTRDCCPAQVGRFAGDGGGCGCP